MYLSRREWLAAGAVWASVAEAQTHSHPSDAAPVSGGLRFFTPEQAREVEAVAAQIIPSDDTPGAREAGVVRFIDGTLATYEKDLQKVYVAGLAQLQAAVEKSVPKASRFSELTSAQQIALLRGFEKTPFFELIRNHTVTGFFSHPQYGGNRDRMGWKLIGFEDAFVFQPPFGYYDGPEGNR